MSPKFPFYKINALRNFDFCVEVVLGSGLNAIGSGSTKRMAETKAAEQILEKIKNINEWSSKKAT